MLSWMEKKQTKLKQRIPCTSFFSSCVLAWASTFFTEWLLQQARI